MQKNWYILYTRMQMEFKVANSLTRKKIENYCPVNQKEKQHFRRTKLVNEALFPSYVFVKITEEELPLVLKFQHVLNIVYWINKPATVSEKEITILKKFVQIHERILVKKTTVNQLAEYKYTENNSIVKLDGNLFKVKNELVNISLPNIGFTLFADTALVREKTERVPLMNKDLSLQ